ncbi:MAG: Transferase hexapeptide repeat containing protein [Parcubacteria group bacterium GW2011_GWA2_42_11]|nr:MAG: Transferase hexapeptide repeat containing protein [Parcubacteria group bacterium GW2011_GWA2_42_11]
MELRDFSYYFDLTDFKHQVVFHNCEYVFDIFKKLEKYIKNNLQPEILGEVRPGATVGQNVFLGRGSVVESGAYITGPAIIGENCQIRHGAYIRANVLLGNNVVVGHASEVSNSIFLDDARAPHFAYVGNSVLGNRVNLGAGVKLANLKLTGAEIEIDKIKTGLIKLGSFIGDDCTLGCNSVCQPGTFLGKKVACHPGALLHGFIASNKIIKVRQDQEETEKLYKCIKI